VDDVVVNALEHAIAELGTLLVQLDKFRPDAEGRALRTACLAIGDRARRAHRHGVLDATLGAELSADADAARAALSGWLDGVRLSARYRAAAAALAAGEMEAVREALPMLFAGVSVLAPPPALFHPVAWQRRGRPRPATEIADEIAGWSTDGIPGDGDVTSPGVDPGLPGVVLHPSPPDGAPVHLAIAAGAPPWVLSLDATGDAVAPGARRRLPFTVVLADPDDELDAWTLDPAGFHRELAAALRTRGIPIAAAE
jgi:hypothetical protein